MDELYKRIVEESPDGMVLSDEEGRIALWNRGMETMTGIPAAQILGTPLWEHRRAPGAESGNTRHPLTFKRDETLKVLRDGAEPGFDRLIEGSLTLPGGELKHLQERRFCLPTEGGYRIGAVIREITDQPVQERRQRDGERRLRSIFRYVPVAIWEEDIGALRRELSRLKGSGVTDLRAYLDRYPEEILRLGGLVDIVDVNDEAVRLMGAPSREEMLTSLSPFIDEGTAGILMEEFVALSEGRSLVEGETKNVRADGSPVHVIIRIVNPPAYHPRDRLLVTTLDITHRVRLEGELKEANSALQRSVEEKSYLLREVYHRVKNNLATVSSLISLKSADMEDSESLSDLKMQIHAIWALHEMLYKGERVDSVRLYPYLTELLSSLFGSLSQVHVDYTLSMDAEIAVDPDTAMCVGLITNELATNAIKYGFTEEQRPHFTVTFTASEEDRYVFVLSNNGRPFPEEVGFPDSASLGLRLVCSLVDQLGGEISLRRSPSAEFTITFPVPEV